MKITLADVERISSDESFSGAPVSVTGIPDGFVFRSPDVIIGDKIHTGEYLAYVPGTDWTTVYGKDEEELLTHYNEEMKKHEEASN